MSQNVDRKPPMTANDWFVVFLYVLWFLSLAIITMLAIFAFAAGWLAVQS